jgi:hypothetical protein
VSRCPYPQTFIDPVSGVKVTNSQYMVWHEGYEAHKMEMVEQAKFMEMYMLELSETVAKVKELKRELEKQKNQFRLQS